ncbi:DUF3551 domain-containing protein [Bradyrhizobium diazoefficiens]|nr:DUF3551 domain-containing protein [Bradyrhizobium diazoefficiens]MBR0847962.1 DUF3551 domain-containing protein [Bradyrhizobium diazoefficiens]
MSTIWKLRLCATIMFASIATDAANAAQYCMSYNCGTYCDFASLAQCNASASGIGGSCAAALPDNASSQAALGQRALPQDAMAQVSPGARMSRGRQPKIIRHHRGPAS